ncbi:NAD(P)-binding domain-containing protein [Cellulomonas telluris]|uniref:NAD(P)-binding domain-containing protein n=1 Tax=Cellulomonas telluris TaxID=2306636 RepID=UPI0010A89E04|nr:NAD(P)-binding domain-containing protein [Cellulomonas telluris]
MEPPVSATPAVAGRRARRHRGRRTVEVDVLVVGAGQAGLSTAYHLQRTGLVAVGSRGWEHAAGTFVVLDDNARAGGAWQHRWRSLTMADAHAVHDLPGMPLVVVDPAEPAADAVPYYFAQYEDAYALNVQRPVRVLRVERAAVPDGVEPRYLVTTRHVDHPDEVVVWAARAVVNASGTWQRPFWPSYPGRGTFRGRQLHTRDYRDARDLADGHVVVVGGGTSAVQLLLQLAQVTTTTWVTRRPPRWVDAEFTPELGREAVSRVDERTRAGLPPRSVVSVTGLPLTPAYRAGIASGVLRARRVFDRIEPDGVAWDPDAPALRARDAEDDGADLPADLPGLAPDLGGWVDGPPFVAARTILWATGFRSALDHLAPLGLRAAGGGIRMDGTEVVGEPRLQLVGYGPSASTIGANRAGREAVRRLRRALGW